MRNFLKKAALSAALLGATTASANFQVNRCSEVKKQLSLPASYNEVQTVALIQWAVRCAPRFTDELTDNQFLIDGAGNQRRLYPVFAKRETVDDPNSLTGKKTIVTNPLNYQINIDAVKSNHATAACDIPEDYVIVAFCGAGCFTPDQSVWFANGDMPIGIAEKMGIESVVAVSKGSTLKNIDYEAIEIKGGRYVQTEKPQKEDVVTIITNDKALTVTTNHPMLTPEGSMIEAGDLKVGDKVVNVDGETEEILAMEEKEFFGKVLNLETDSTDMKSHILAAEGLLTGDFYIQTMDLSKANRHLIRQALFPVETLK